MISVPCEYTLNTNCFWLTPSTINYRKLNVLVIMCAVDIHTTISNVIVSTDLVVDDKCNRLFYLYRTVVRVRDFLLF